LSRIKILAWRPGAQKVAANHAIRQHSSLGLADAYKAVDSVLNGQPVSFEALNAEHAADLANTLGALGFEVQLLDGAAETPARL
jgi:ribosomal protein L7/L12